MSSMEDRMIEAVGRDGVDPDEAYDVVRDRMAEAADRSFWPNGQPMPTSLATPVVLAKDRIFVNEDSTVLVTLWSEGKTVTVATREHSSHTWGPPKYLKEEK